MTPTVRTSEDLRRFIERRGIAATILPMEEDTPTVPDAARALGVSEAQIIKSLVFLVNGKPALIIANGTARIDYRKLATHFGVGRKRVKLASAEQALEISGYVVGSMPPFGHKTPLPTVVDSGVMALPVVFGGGGEIHALLQLSPQTLAAATGAKIISVMRIED